MFKTRFKTGVHGAAALLAVLALPFAAKAQEAPPATGFTPGQNTAIIQPKLPSQQTPVAPIVAPPSNLSAVPSAASADDNIPIVAALKGVVFVAGTQALTKDGLPVGAAGAGGVAAPQLPLLNDPKFLDAIKAHLDKPLTKAVLRQIEEETRNFYRGHQRPYIDVAAPSQNVDDGLVQIVVSEYRLGDVEVTGVRYFSKGLLMKPVDLQKGQTLTQGQVQDNLDRLNENPFVSVDAEFKPGKDDGETDLVLHAKDRFPLRVYAGYDNQGVPTLDELEWNAGFNWGNAFGTGQILSYQYTRAFDGRFTSHSASDVIRIDNDDKILVFGNYATMRAAAYLFGLSELEIDSTGHTTQGSFRWVRTLPKLFGGALTGHIQLGYDFKSTDNNAFFDETQLGPLSLMETNQFPIVYDGSEIDKWGSTTIENDLVFAPGRLTGRDNDADFQSLVAGAKARYAYDRLSVTRTQHLPLDLSLIGRVNIQRSSAILPNSEQLGGGGVGSVRGYLPDTGLGSNGELLSLELRAPAFSPGRVIGMPKLDDLVQVGLFYDYASLRQPYYPIDALSSDPSNGTLPLDLASTGFLLHYSVSHRLDLNFDLGFQLRHTPDQEKLGSFGAVAVVFSN